jgi:hypothetical protein
MVVANGCSSSVRKELSGYTLVNACGELLPDVRIDAAAPAWLSKLLQRGFHDTLLQATSLFGDLGPTQPRMYVTFSPAPGGATWRGWTSGSELFLNFYGDWTESPELIYQAEKYVTHEVLHLWNGWKRRSGDTTPAWLTEGYAEFFALELMRARGSIDGARLQGEILERSAQCLSSRGSAEAPLNAPESAGGSAIYDCGVMSVYTLDRQLGSDTLEQASAPWRRLFNQQTSTEVTLDQVLTSYAVYSEKLRTDQEDAGGFQMTSSAGLPALQRLGIVPSRDITSAHYLVDARNAFLQSLVEHVCDAPPYGFSTYASYVKLDTADRCGPLSGDPEITGVAGKALFGDNALDGVEMGVKACNAGGNLRLNLKTGGEVVVPCRKPMTMARPRISLTCPPMAMCSVTTRSDGR